MNANEEKAEPPLTTLLRADRELSRRNFSTFCSPGREAGADAEVQVVAERPVSPAGRGNIQNMRRWVFAFLLFVVPFQLAWGSAAPYCAHEASASGKKHFGHHEHKHRAGGEVVSATDDADDTPGAFHADCESCQLGCSALIRAATPATEGLPHGNTVGHPDPRYNSHIPAGPLRPDRPHATPVARFGGNVAVVSLAD